MASLKMCCGRITLACAAAIGVAAGVSAGQPATPAPPGAPPAPMPVEPRQQYDNALVNLALVVMNPETPDEEAAKAARKFLEEARAVPGGVASLKEAQRTITAIERALENKDRESTDEDLAKLGPASAGGYVGTVEGGGALIRFKGDAA